MAEPLKDIRDWLETFPDQGHTLAVGDMGLELLVLDQFNREVGTFEIGGVPDLISKFADDAAEELMIDGMEPGVACGIAADAERIIRSHTPGAISNG